MLYVITGRNGSMKNEFKDILENTYGWKFAKTYTTAPKDNTKEHIYITKNESKKIPASHKIALSKKDDYEYFTTIEELENKNAIILDLKGLKDIQKDYTTTVLYLISEHDEKDTDFDTYDKEIAKTYPPEIEVKKDKTLLIKHKNSKDELLRYAESIEGIRNSMENISRINDFMLNRTTFNISDPKKKKTSITINNKTVELNRDEFAKLIYSNIENPSANFFIEWLSTPGIVIDIPDVIYNYTENLDEMIHECFNIEFFDNVKKEIKEKENHTVTETEIKDFLIHSDELMYDFRDILTKHISRYLLSMMKGEIKNGI